MSDERKKLPNADQTDWKRLESVTDDEIQRMAADDPDVSPILSIDEMKERYVLHPPRRKKNK